MTERCLSEPADNCDNPPRRRFKAGPRRDDHIDRVVHYGLLPDFLRDVHNFGLTKEDVASLSFNEGLVSGNTDVG